MISFCTSFVTKSVFINSRGSLWSAVGDSFVLFFFFKYIYYEHFFPQVLPQE